MSYYKLPQMQLTQNFRLVLAFAIPAIIIGVALRIFHLQLFAENSELFSIAATIDLILFSPIVYFYFIRKTIIPNLTVFPFTFFVIFIASVFIPSEQQSTLSFLKHWFLPFVEIFLLIYIGFNFHKLYKRYKNNSLYGIDNFLAYKYSLIASLPNFISSYLVMETALFYYTFFKWSIKKNNKFEYKYTGSGLLPVLFILIPMILVEAFVIHILLASLSNIAAWILTGLSTYTLFQLIGIIKSILYRPIFINDNHLHLRYGILRDTVIDIANISKIIPSSSGNITLSVFKDLESINLTIYLDDHVKIKGLFGKVIDTREISFFINNKEKFIEDIQKLMKK